MKRKKQPISATAIRLSSYERYSKERMDTIIKRLDDLTVEVKDLRIDMSKGKGVIAFLIIVGGLVGSVLAILKFVK